MTTFTLQFFQTDYVQFPLYDPDFVLRDVAGIKTTPLVVANGDVSGVIMADGSFDIPGVDWIRAISVGVDNLDFSIVRATWGTGSSVLLHAKELHSFELDQYGVANSFIRLGGDPLPIFTDRTAFEAFWASATVATPDPAGPFGPGQSIRLADLPDVLSVREADIHYGTYGVDVVYGGSGDDLFIEYFSNRRGDHLDGGSGTDTVDFTRLNQYSAPSADNGVIIDLAYSARNAWGAFRDVYVEIENAIGTSWRDGLFGSAADNHLQGLAGPDVLFGRAGRDILDGGDGSDTLRGGQGNDILIGGAGGDALIGDAGHDRADYRSAVDGVVVDLMKASRNTGDAAGDTYSGIEGVVGGNGADEMFGSSLGDELIALGGNDLLNGRGGDDVLFGGAGRDRLFGGPGDDDLRGGAGGDVFIFTRGQDTIHDFGAADRIILRGLNLGSNDPDTALRPLARTDGHDLFLTLAPGDVVRLNGYDDLAPIIANIIIA